jgi:hypothetical protein
LRHEPPHVFRRHPGVPLGRPHVRLANAEGPFGHKPASPDIPLGLMQTSLRSRWRHNKDDR